MKDPYAECKTFAELPKHVQAGVNAYDEARRKLYGRQNEPPMSDENKRNIAPMIFAAVVAMWEAQGKEPKL